MVIGVPLVFVIVGLLLWGFASGKAAEFGRLLVLAGLIWMLNAAEALVPEASAT